MKGNKHTPQRWTLSAVLTIVVFGLTVGLQLSDQGIQNLSLSRIQASFDVGDSALGALQGIAGFLIGSLLAMPLARLVDAFSRKRVLLCYISASSCIMVLSALSPNFHLFFIARSSAAILEFAMIPLVYSVIPDLVPDKDRVIANLGFAAIMAAGASGGYYFGSDIIQAANAAIALELEAWRKGFLFLSALGIPLLILGVFVADPSRCISTTNTFADSISQFLQKRWKPMTLFLGLAGCMLIAVQALNQLIVLSLERRFDANMATIGESMGIILLTVSACSIPLAGILDKLLGRRLKYASRPAIMGVAALSAIPALLMINTTVSLEQALLGVGTFLMLTAIANSLVPTMLQDLVPAPLRARCFALWSFLISVFAATGPFLVGVFSESVFKQNLMLAMTTVAIPALSLSCLFAVKLFQRQSLLP